MKTFMEGDPSLMGRTKEEAARLSDGTVENVSEVRMAICLLILTGYVLW